MVGKTIAHYEILEPLGKGGMGEVYRARDSKLDRDVAIKVLPEDLAGDPDRLARLQREAKLLAALNHPNIATVHALEGEEGASFLVLELVTGESLERKLAKGPLPVEKALDICKQIAEALEAAHGAGIIHRDLKPANVLVTPDGRAKVLDFGIAKSMQVDAKVAATAQATNLTVAGTLIGTPSYMSPEQVRGGEIDKRVDIWAFGCLLFETLTARSAFAKETMADTLAAIVDQEPDWDALPNEISPQVRRLIGRCLRKDPDGRLHDIADARIEIAEATGEPTLASLGEDTSTSPLPSRAAWFVPWVIAAIASSVAMFMGYQWATSPNDDLIHLPVLPADVTPRVGSGGVGFAISADGSRLAYWVRSDGGSSQLFVKSWDELVGTRIADSSFVSPTQEIFFSPDGGQIGFSFDGKLWRMPAEGGPRLEITDIPGGNTRGATWGRDDIDDMIVFSGGSQLGLFQVSATRREAATQLTTLNRELGEVSHRWPQVLPGGKEVLFVAKRGADMTQSNIAIYSFETGNTRTIDSINGTYARFVPTGHLLYAGAAALFAVGFDLDTLEVTSPPVPVQDSLFADRFTQGAAAYRVADNGTFVYFPERLDENDLVTISRDARVEPLPGVPVGQYSQALDLTSDGRRLALSGAGELFVYDLIENRLTPISTDHHSRSAIWVPNANKIVFNASDASDLGEHNLYEIPVDASGPPTRLTTTPLRQSATSVSPDGSILLIMQYDQESMLEILEMRLGGTSTPEPLVQTSFNEDSAVFSPDGGQVAYSSNRTGRNEIYVMPYPNRDQLDLRRDPISTGGGAHPRWSPDGTELFFISEDRLMVAAVGTQPQFQLEPPKELLRLGADILTGFSGWPAPYVVLPDGEGFVFVRRTQRPPYPLLVYFNWFEKLKRSVPAAR